MKKSDTNMHFVIDLVNKDKRDFANERQLHIWPKEECVEFKVIKNNFRTNEPYTVECEFKMHGRKAHALGHSILYAYETLPDNLEGTIEFVLAMEKVECDRKHVAKEVATWLRIERGDTGADESGHADHAIYWEEIEDKMDLDELEKTTSDPIILALIKRVRRLRKLAGFEEDKDE